MNEGIAKRSPNAIRSPNFSTGINRGVQNGTLGFPGKVSATGGTVSNIDNIRYHTFTSSGTLNVVTGGKVEILIVSGGGGGGSGVYAGAGGGGGGGGATVIRVPVVNNERLTIVVGAGAAGPSYLGSPIPGNTSSVTGTFGRNFLIGGGSGGWGGYYQQYGSGVGACLGAAGIANSWDWAGAPIFGISLVPVGGGGGGMGTVGGNSNTTRTPSSMVYQASYGFTSGTSGFAQPDSTKYKGIIGKQITSNVATLTIPGHTFLTNDGIFVTGAGTPFDGSYVVTTTTTNTLSYAKTNANIGFTTIGYAVTNKQLTSNVAQLTIGTHTLVVGNNINVNGVDSTFDGMYTITAVTETTVSYAKTASSIISQTASGTATNAYALPYMFQGGSGGNGIEIWGNFYCGGGGGGSSFSLANGGLGGGGNGSTLTSGTGSNGAANTGGGGGGASFRGGSQTNGGSGIVIVRYSL
jgi:hypothetical protein